MRKFRRVISTVLLTVMLLGTLPIMPISAATLANPFTLTTASATDNVINSVSINSSESLGNNGEVSLFNAKIQSTGTRQSKNADKGTKIIYKSVNVAIGGRLFTYSMPSTNHLDFSVNYIEDIAKKFEADHPEWEVAVVSNGSFFDNSTTTTPEKGETEDIYAEDGKIYKTWIDTSKNGRGVIGLKSDGSMIYYTQGDAAYLNTNTLAKKYSFNAKYTLHVLGENKNNPIYKYSLLENGSFDYTSEPIFITPSMAAKDLRGAQVYKVKCSEYRRAHVGVNDTEIGSKTHFFEGVIESIVSGTSSMQPTSGYVFIASYTKLEHLKVGVSVRGTRFFSGDWADVQYAFGFKHQILKWDTSKKQSIPMFKGVNDKTTSSSEWYNRCDEVKYCAYDSNRTALGFKEDGTPVIISMARNTYYGSDGKQTYETSPSSNELAWYMKSIGCTNAFMMDCGGSACMYKKTADGKYVQLFSNPHVTQGQIIAERPIANVLILAYPSGEAAKKTDATLPEPNFAPGYITTGTKNTWHYGLTWQGTDTTPLNTGSETTTGAITTTNFKLAQSAAKYTFTPLTLQDGYTAMYMYKSLGFTVQSGKKYVYCFKMATKNDGKYAAVLFGKKPDFEDNKNKLNDFATIGGTFSNNLGDGTYADVRVGYGRLVKNDDTEQGILPDRSLKLYQEVDGGVSYGYCRVDIDGLNYTVKVKKADGSWYEIPPKNGSKYYTLPSGTELVLGATAWEGDFDKRIMYIMDPICVDITELSNNIATANSLVEEEYTPETWAAIQPALTKANYSVKLTYQSLINYANKNLKTALDGLVKRVDIAKANIAEYESKNADDYTTESWAPYTVAYNDLVTAVAANNLTALDGLNSAYAAAKANLVAASVSLDVAWQTMSFTYETDSARWDPQTHTYVDDGGGSSSGWVANDNSNVIELTNNSNIALDVGFKFTRDDSVDGISGVSGAFYSNDSAVTTVALAKDGATQSVSFMLDGAPTESLDNAKCGTVTLTVTRRKE